ncbi:MAG: hypothetical protein IPM63_05365 [Acidobacteriota bacterium]|nr:MAG: hypothetical protein IPM63_05365 [Acidobacteriota bacterium]
MDFLFDFWNSLSWGSILLGVGVFLLSVAVSYVAIVVVVVKLPEHYFSPHYKEELDPSKPWLMRWGAVILKNLLGVFLILLGLALSLPGIPGQGILTILLGLIMLDIPGKRPFEARIVRRPRVLSAINRLRARHNKPPLVMD